MIGGRTTARARWRARSLERAIETLIGACGWSSILFVFAIIAFVFTQAAPVIWRGLDLLEFAGSVNWRPDSVIRPQFGTLALMTGTIAVTTLATLIAVPAGFAAAVFLSEFCAPAWREALKVTVECLAAVPSVVWGFFGYMVLNPLLLRLTDAPIGLNVLNGAIILALMSVPIIVSVGDDALKAVPDAYREAAVALGAGKTEVILKVLLPAARRGLLAAALLGVGRAIGETIAVLMVTGHAVQVPGSIFDPVRTLTATIAAELGETVHGSDHYRVLFAIGGELVLISVVINVTADLIVKGVRPGAAS